MKKLLFIILLLQISVTQAVTLNDFKNNKEAFSRLLTKKMRKSIDSWVSRHSLRDDLLKEKSQKSLKDSIETMNRNDLWCEMTFIEVLKKNALREGVIRDNRDFSIFINYLREVDLIDDLLLEILQNFHPLSEKFSPIGLSKQTKTDKNSPYSLFSPWPTEKNSCLQSVYSNFLDEIQKIYSRNDTKFLGKLNLKHLQNGTINQETFNRLEALRFDSVTNLDLYLDSYIKNLKTVKDKMTDEPEDKTEVSFSEFYVYRRSNLTRRGKLYTEYSNTQILLMSQLIEKTAKRIDAFQVHLYFQYDEENSDNETYIFSPMEQYRIAVKMLRKDMAELRRSELFRNSAIYYEDIIAAAFETGIITSKELNHVLEFDDLWNPKVSKWRGIANFSLSIAGTATFLLPSPLNYVAAIALIFTQSRLAGGKDSENPEDNENVII